MTKYEVGITNEILELLAIDFEDYSKHPQSYREIFNDWFRNTEEGKKYFKDYRIKAD